LRPPQWGQIRPPFPTWAFKRNGTKWEQVGKKLVADGTGATKKASQGSSVALSAGGETALVGAEDDEPGGKEGEGAVFVFTFKGSEYVQQGGPLVGHPTARDAKEGASIALSADGTTALIGAPRDEGEKGEREAGGVWAFVEKAGKWEEQAKLPQAPGTGLETGQGESVALSGDGDTALVGGPGYKTSGAAWAYARNGDTWEQQGPPLLGEDAGTFEADEEGAAVALSENGDTALVGGLGDDTARGAAWAFVRAGANWSEQQKLEMTGASEFAHEGAAVALSADGYTALVGGPGDTGEVGATWVFARAPESEPEPKHEPEPTHEPETKPAGKNPNSNTGGGSTGSSSAGTSSSQGAAASTPGVATTPQAVEELRLGCTGRPLVLNDVLIRDGRVALSGSAAKTLVGKRVAIVFDGSHKVATATVAADGQFATTAPLPPVRLRDSNNARYMAEQGRQRSLNLKLTRRLELEPPTFAGGTVTLAGQVLPPLATPVAGVAVQQQLECGRTTIVKHFKPGAGGRFHVTVTVPADAKAGIYRLTSAVAVKPGSRHTFATYSLPLPALLG
jgi:hypothetical protein